MTPSAATAPTRPTIGPRWNDDPFGVWPVSMSMATQLYDWSAPESVTTMRRPLAQRGLSDRRVCPGADRGTENGAPGMLDRPEGASYLHRRKRVGFKWPQTPVTPRKSEM